MQSKDRTNVTTGYKMFSDILQGIEHGVKGKQGNMSNKRLQDVFGYSIGNMAWG